MRLCVMATVPSGPGDKPAGGRLAAAEYAVDMVRWPFGPSIGPSGPLTDPSKRDRAGSGKGRQNADRGATPKAPLPAGNGCAAVWTAAARMADAAEHCQADRGRRNLPYADARNVPARNGEGSDENRSERSGAAVAAALSLRCGGVSPSPRASAPAALQKP